MYIFDEEIYQKIKKYINYTVFLLLIPFPGFPIIGQFFNLYVVFVGLFRVSPIKALALVTVGRIAYYSYYLLLL
jgi:membrane protein YqaA with SNARE-associated domain